MTNAPSRFPAPPCKDRLGALVYGPFGRVRGRSHIELPDECGPKWTTQTTGQVVNIHSAEVAP
jgi:hypothetical protein